MRKKLLDLFGYSSPSQFVKEYGWWAILFSLIIIWPVIGFLPSMPQPVLYTSMAVVSIWAMSKSAKYCTPLVLLLLYLPFEILVTTPPALFSPWMRYVLFVFVLMSVSSLFESHKLNAFRIKILKLILLCCVVLGVGSFIARFLGINYMENFWAKDIATVGIFGGLTKHSMLLGPISGISVVYLVYKFFVTKNKLLLVLAIMSLGSVLFSASRAALLATICGLVALVYVMNLSVGKIVKYILIILFVGALTAPYWGDYLEKGFVAKNGGSMAEISTSSRDSKWENRIEEFKSNPIFGIGFSSVDLKNYQDYSSVGGTETGSSWLAVLSMTGIIGAALVLWTYLISIIKCLKIRSPQTALLCGIIILFTVSMLAEGYIFAGGNFLCILFWLTLGCAYCYNTSDKVL